MFFEGIDQRIPFTMTATHKGVVYLNQYNIKSLIKLSEVKKFCDGTLVKIQENLFDMLSKNKLGSGNKRHREQLRRLEEYVGGCPKTVNPHTFVRPIYRGQEKSFEINKAKFDELETDEKKRLKSDFKTREDELLDKLIQYEKKIKELDNIMVKTGQSIQTMHILSPKPNSFYHNEQNMTLGYQNPFYLKQAQQKQQSLYNGRVLLEKHDPPAVYDSKETLQLAQEKAAKFVRDFKSLAKEADESLDKIMVLEKENERLLRAVVSQDIMSIVQRPTVVETFNFQTELELERLQAQLGDLKGQSMNTHCASNTLDPLSQKLNDENVSLDNTESESDTSVCDNASASNPQEPTSKGFPNSTSFIDKFTRLRRQNILVDGVTTTFQLSRSQGHMLILKDQGYIQGINQDLKKALNFKDTLPQALINKNFLKEHQAHEYK
ncbi:hypothetical protein Tco_0237924 [Tanacetum coccineum]